VNKYTLKLLLSQDINGEGNKIWKEVEKENVW
jgi:hypothetical protein